MSAVSVSAFVDELTKLATKEYDNAADMKKDLQVGDILLTSAKKPSLLGHLVSLRQGTPFGHSALYAGNGKVIDTRTQEGVFKTTLKEIHESWGGGRSIMVLRPRATDEQKQQAVEKAKEYIGTPYDMKGVARLILPAKGNEKDEGLTKKREAIFCSQLITRAYPDLQFAKTKYRDHVMPVDFARSSLTQRVGILR
jgi:uncharacterized protein YycO